MADQKYLKYIQVKHLLVDRFADRQYRHGQKLPTEFELMKEMAVSRTTVRQALKELETDGLVERRHGSGTFFKDRRVAEKSDKSGIIGLANFYFTDYIYPDIARGIEETLDEAGYSLALANSREAVDKEISSVVRLINQGVKGLILEPSRNLQTRTDHPMLKVLDDAEIPVVTTHWGIADKKLSTVTIDDIQAGYEAAQYLLSRGHTRIAIIYKYDIQAGYDRFIGYRNALNEADIPLNSDWVLGYNHAEESADKRQGYLLTRKLLSGAEHPTAIFYFNDNIAAQGYSAIQEAKLSIPGDISVIGFDNFRNTDTMFPPLTTFEHPKYDLGRWAAKILLDEMDGSRPSMPIKLVFEPVLVERESVRTLDS